MRKENVKLLTPGVVKIYKLMMCRRKQYKGKGSCCEVWKEYTDTKICNKQSYTQLNPQNVFLCWRFYVVLIYIYCPFKNNLATVTYLKYILQIKFESVWILYDFHFLPSIQLLVSYYIVLNYACRPLYFVLVSQLIKRKFPKGSCCHSSQIQTNIYLCLNKHQIAHQK